MVDKGIESIIHTFPKKSVLVIGDVMLDQYTFGNVTRISPEAPVPVIQKTTEKFTLGGASNVANNIASLGAKVSLVGIVGNDHRKEIFLNLLKEKGIKPLLITSKIKPTILKNRIMVSDFQQLFRFDDEIIKNSTPAEEKKILEIIEKEMVKVDVVVLSDYAKGFFSKSLTSNVVSMARKKKKIIIADLKPQNMHFFMGVDLIAPNEKEAFEMTGETDLEKAGDKLLREFKSSILITRGPEGMALFENKSVRKDFAARKIKVFDVSGAGDTVMAVLALGLASGLNTSQAVDVANHAGGIVVQKPGTATLNLEELESDFHGIKHSEAVDIVPKLWGYEKWLENNDRYCCKLLVVNKGYQCSLHYHKEKDEMFYVSKGHIRLESDGKISYMKEGNFTRILPGTKHRFRGIEDSVIVEVSTHHEESDSHRIEESKKVE